MREYLKGMNIKQHGLTMLMLKQSHSSFINLRVTMDLKEETLPGWGSSSGTVKCRRSRGLAAQLIQNNVLQCIITQSNIHLNQPFMAQKMLCEENNIEVHCIKSYEWMLCCDYHLLLYNFIWLWEKSIIIQCNKKKQFVLFYFFLIYINILKIFFCLWDL